MSFTLLSRTFAAAPPATSPPTCAAVRKKPSRVKVVGVHTTAACAADAGTIANARQNVLRMTNALRMCPPIHCGLSAARQGVFSPTEQGALVDATLRARHALSPRIALRRRVERAPERLERRLQQVMRVAAAQLRDVERAARALCQRDEEVGHERRVERADDARLRLQIVREVRPPTEVEGDAYEAFVHRHLERRVADQALAVAEGLVDRGAEHQADVLDGVVLVDLDIALGLHRQVEEAMHRDELEHVVEERQSGADG